jgi:hypothetical protein
MSSRHLLLRLLLLAVFFNTAVGLPLHDAVHLREAVADTAQERAVQAATEGGSSSEHGESVHGLCAWCLAYAQQTSAPSSLPVLHGPAELMAQQRPRSQESLFPCPGRWPFAARDPPNALT